MSSLARLALDLVQPMQTVAGFPSLAMIASLSLLVGCSGGGGDGGVAGAGEEVGEPVQRTSRQLGDPLPGLTPEEEAAFHRGREVFNRRFKPSEGLGPFYNATSCASCHSTPVSGGSAQLYRNFYICMLFDLGVQRKLPELPSAVMPAYGTGAHSTATFTLEGGRISMPDPAATPETVTIGQRNAIPIFGTGLFEFISNATIFSNADPEDADGDGISGRYNTDFGAVGRFGTKAQANNIELFTRGPLQNQMGITSDPFLGLGSIVSSSLVALQVTTDPNTPLEDSDGVPDPEISHDDLGDLIAFSRFLGPPAPLPFTPAAQNGEALFDQIGCTKCHIPTLPSSRGPVNAYTDLLIHDMGPDLADGLSLGFPQPTTTDPWHTGNEWRTQPLWGVSLSRPFLHDGRAETLVEAISMHGGEAEAIRDAFLALTPSEQADIVEFLEKL